MGGRRLAELPRAKHQLSTPSTNRARGQVEAITAENHPGNAEGAMALEVGLV